MAELLDEVIGNYRITGVVGRGGMGAVYEAEHVMLGKKVAVKVLLPDRCESREVVDRFFNEAKAASLIRDPGIVDVFDFGLLSDGNAYIVMELLEGETLGQRIKREVKLSPLGTISISRHVAGTLAAAHQNGIIHRDLKPDNVFLVPDPAMPRGERSKLLDFGIAKLANPSGPSDMVKTETGRLMGTPYYMSPEQCRGAGRVDSRTDIYSLGCMMYQMLTGRPPFVLEGAGEILAAHIHVPPTRPRAHEPSIPAELEQVVMRMLAKDPAERFQSMHEVVDALNLVAAGFSSHEDSTEPSLAESDRYPARRNQTDGIASDPIITQGTTLSSTSGEMTGRSHRSAKLGVFGTVAAVAGLVAAAGFALYIGVRGVSDTPDQPRAAAGAGLDGGLGLPEAIPDASLASPVVKALEPAPAPAAEPAKVNLLLVSTPDGATVYREADGVRLGKTPLTVRVRRGDGEAAFIVRRPGYHSEELAVPVQEDQEVMIRLRKRGERSDDQPTVTSTPTDLKAKDVPAGKGESTGTSSSAASKQAGGSAGKGSTIEDSSGADTSDREPRGRDDAIDPFNDFLHRSMQNDGP